MAPLLLAPHHAQVHHLQVASKARFTDSVKGTGARDVASKLSFGRPHPGKRRFLEMPVVS